jgi:hypothetical protein
MNTTPTIPSFDAALARFVADAQALVDAHMAADFPRNPRKVLAVMRGGRYARITVDDVRDGKPAGQRSCFCFVDSTNGDVLKAAGWKAPAKGARGNIYTYTNVNECITSYGAHYAR